jgi:release factor glutamine methyltransferase
MSIRPIYWPAWVMSKNLGSVHQEAVEQLKPCSDSARMDADLILSFALQIPRTRFITQAELPVGNQQYQIIQELIKQRKSGLPVSYITGRKGFWDVELFVSEHTLIPRPETELLVEFALSVFPANKPLNVIDLGTGTGAIAIAIARSRPNWQVFATDVSEPALKVAKQNCDKYKLSNIELMQSDWFSTIDDNLSFDLIISNPPYVAESDTHLSEGDVRFEPIIALSSGPQGLDDLQKIVAHSKDYLNEHGWLIVEHGFDQDEAVKSLFTQHGYATIQQGMDLNGHIRATYGQR